MPINFSDESKNQTWTSHEYSSWSIWSNLSKKLSEVICAVTPPIFAHDYSRSNLFGSLMAITLFFNRISSSLTSPSVNLTLPEAQSSIPLLSTVKRAISDYHSLKCNSNLSIALSLGSESHLLSLTVSFLLVVLKSSRKQSSRFLYWILIRILSAMICAL